MLDIQSHLCRMGKISNNLEKAGDEEHVTGFTIPITEFRLTSEQFEAFFDRPYAARGLHDAKADKQMPALDFIEPYVVKHSFEGASLMLAMNGGRGKSMEFDGCKVKTITFEPLEGPANGGMIELAFSVYLHPGLGKDNLLLQQNQDTEIHLTIQDAVVATKAKDKQQDLFPKETGEGFAAGAAALADKQLANGTSEDTNEDAARAQVEAFNRGSENSESAPTPNDTAEFAGKAAEKISEFRERSRRSSSTKDAH